MNFDTAFSDQNRHTRFLLGLYISRKRAETGYSVDEVASRLEVTAQAYKRIESGRLKIDAEMFNKIKSVLLLNDRELVDIRRISGVAYINDLAKALGANYPV